MTSLSPLSRCLDSSVSLVAADSFGAQCTCPRYGGGGGPHFARTGHSAAADKAAATAWKPGRRRWSGEPVGG